MRGASVLRCLACGLLLLAVGCAPAGAPDAGVVDDAGPPEVPGGGTSGADIDGRLRVFVVDAAVGAPVPNALVRVGEADDEVASGVTDGDGALMLTGLSGPQTVTVHGEGLIPATWFGVGVENVTLPVVVEGAGAPKGRISGEVADFHANFQPFGDHYTLVHIRVTSADGNLSRAEAALGIEGDPSCAHNGEHEPPCTFNVEVPAGRVSLLATILEIDGQGTPLVLTDDELVGVMGYAYALDVEVGGGEIVDVGALTQLEAGQLEELTYPFPANAPELPRVLGFALLDLGDRGLLPVFVPFTPEMAAHPVPALGGPFADASYLLYGRAAEESGRQASGGLVHDVTSLESAAPLPPWMEPPGELSADDRTFSWSAVDGAQLYRAELRERGATLLWSLYVLDGRTELTLPELLPRLPNGTMHLRVRALAGDIDVRRLVLDELVKRMERTSEDTVIYTR